MNRAKVNFPPAPLAVNQRLRLQAAFHSSVSSPQSVASPAAQLLQMLRKTGGLGAAQRVSVP